MVRRRRPTRQERTFTKTTTVGCGLLSFSTRLLRLIIILRTTTLQQLLHLGTVDCFVNYDRGPSCNNILVDQTRYGLCSNCGVDTRILFCYNKNRNNYNTNNKRGTTLLQSVSSKYSFLQSLHHLSGYHRINHHHQRKCCSFY